MGLDLTNIPDKAGIACYILMHDTSVESERFEQIVAELSKLTQNQIQRLYINTAEGEQVRDFYDLMPEQLPAVLLVHDDDHLVHSWWGTDIPSADVIAHHMQVAGQEDA